MKNIVLVSNTSWSLYNFRLSVIKMLQQNGFKVYCIANIDDYSQRLVNEGVEFIKSELANKGTNPYQDFKYFKFLKKQYKLIRPDFVFHYTVKPNIYGSMAAGQLKIPSIAIVCGAGHAFSKKDYLYFIVKRLYSVAAKNAKEFWFINKIDQHLFVSEKIIENERTKVLPGEGINTEGFIRSKPYPKADGWFTFLISSRMLWDKGIGIYVDAARLIKLKYQNVRFQLLGFIDELNPSAIAKKTIDEWANEGVIEYLGVSDNVAEILMNINCFVLPSYYREGVPRSLLEAASLEIPIITTDNVGCNEVVKDGFNGFLCRMKDSHNLAEKMEIMINSNYDGLKEMGVNGRDFVVNQFHERFVIKFYSDLIKSSSF